MSPIGKSQSVLEMLLTMDDKSSKELKKVDKNLGKVDKAAKKSSKGIKGMRVETLAMGAAIGGSIAGVAALAKGLYELGGRGAAVQQTGESFEFLLDKIGVSDIVLIIGRPREFSSEKYILIESIKKIPPAWAKVRKLELEKNLIGEIIKKKGNKVVSDKHSIEENVVDLGPHNRVFRLIKELDKGEGVSIEELSSRNIIDIDKVIDILLKEGDIFEIKPGKLKVLE